MQPLDSHFPSPEFSQRNASRAPFQLVRVNEHGIVLESQSSYEIGTTVALGFHVNCDGRSGKSRFISVEAILVGAKPRVTKGGLLIQEITLMFSEIDREDHEILLRAPELFEASVPDSCSSVKQLMNSLN